MHQESYKGSNLSEIIWTRRSRWLRQIRCLESDSQCQFSHLTCLILSDSSEHVWILAEGTSKDTPDHKMFRLAIQPQLTNVHQVKFISSYSKWKVNKCPSQEILLLVTTTSNASNTTTSAHCPTLNRVVGNHCWGAVVVGPLPLSSSSHWGDRATLVLVLASVLILVLVVFRSPVARLEKNWDWTGIRLLETDFQLQLHAV